MIVDIPEIYQDIFLPARYKVFYGGRGSAKTETVATFLILKALESKCTILCCREYKVSIANSVHAVLKKIIDRLGLQQYFTINNENITCNNGSKFIFAGLHNNIDSIKSIPNIKYCWVEEAQTLTQRTLTVLRPTIRDIGSEILFTFNPYREDDPIYKFFIEKPPTKQKTLIVKTYWYDNPFFTEALENERLEDLEGDMDEYHHIWDGECLKHSEAVIFSGKYKIGEVTTNNNWSVFYGLDFGFTHPTFLIKCWVSSDKVLYIEREAGGTRLDTQDLPGVFSAVMPEAHKYKIRADCSRPETISELQLLGYKGVTACIKGPGSIQDGVAYIRSFKNIIIHPSCVNTIQEFRLYSYKVDRMSGDILPDIVDKHNHCIDALRYALEPLIKHVKRGTIRVL